MEIVGDENDLHRPPGRWLLQVSLKAAAEIPPPGKGLEPLPWAQDPETWVRETDGEFRLWRPGFSFFLDLAKREGEAQISWPREWQSVLRIIYFHGFLQHQGCLLHAAGLVRQGLAYLFPGPSGAGKTTIVRQSPGMAVLSDEFSGVQVAGNGAETRAFGTPIYGDWGQPGENLAAPLRGLYFPQQAKHNAVVPLSSREVLTRLLHCLSIFTTRRQRLRRLFDLTVQLAERVPGYSLHFRPDPGLWQAIDAS
ncbi:MAG: hypothetical protein AB1491_01575 [Thermodesulfobacteriota bacterium]